MQQIWRIVKVMKILYNSTICISAEKNPAVGQILPILRKPHSEWGGLCLYTGNQG